MPRPRSFDGFVEHTKRVSPTCLVHFERNRYSVPASYANRPVSLRVYADRLVIAAEGQIVASMFATSTAATTRQPWDRTPAAMRRVLTAGEVEAAGSALVRFVGIEAYEAAGGVVRRDLFDDAQSRFLSDAALVQRLATDKLENLAEAVRAEGWAWVEARLDVDSHALRQFAPCSHTLRKPTGYFGRA